MKQRIFKKLFVIHNLESFVEKEQVQTYIDDYLKHSATFELKENHYIETGGSAIVKKNQKVLTIYTNPRNFLDAKEALKRAGMKFPVSCRVVVDKGQELIKV